MKAIQLTEPRKFEIVDVEHPGAPGPAEALVRTHRMGICGTDYSCYLGKFPFFDYPRIPGHELGVEVVSVGDEVSNVQAGDRCSVEPYLNCGTCYPCRRGAFNCCANLKVIGVMINGGLCEEFIMPADKLHPSKIMSYEQLSLVETLAIGGQACDRGNVNKDDNVLIIGAGPIGLATLEFTRLAGAKITVMDMVESRLDFCRKNYGIEHLIQFKGDGGEVEQMKELTNGDLYQIVTDATGHQGSMSNALNYVAPTGTLVYVGITTQNINFPHPLLHKPEMTIKASRNALPNVFTRIIELIENDQINTAPWITHRTKFENVADEFDAFTRPESGVLKAIIELT